MTASIRPTSLACLGWALVLVAAGPAGAADDPPPSSGGRRLVVQGGGKIGAGALVVAELKGSIPPRVYLVKRDGNGNGSAGMAEVFDKAGKTCIAIALDRAEGDGTASLTLTEHYTGAAANPAIASSSGASELAITAGGAPFVTYVTSEPTKPYYYPVIGPTGAPFTRAYPMASVEGEDKDHPHQRSLWFTHGLVNGLDFWASDPKNKPNPKSGSIKETSRAIVANGRRVAVIRTTDDWLGPDGKKVCEDERVVGFYAIGPSRVIDFDITLKATAGPVVFGDTKEGMFGVRVASSMDVTKKKGGKITNAEGITDDKAWGKASPWVDYTGPVEGKTVGIAILNHPDSFRYPTTWHVRTYGLFAANPFGWHDFGQGRSGEHTLPSGESIRFRYRIVLHTGDTASADIASAFQAYTQPPRVEVEAK